jgi:ubiquinone/menaquinone biosynthesis C-methylase UbiE
MLTRAFDASVRSFDRHRALPDGVPEVIRASVLGAIGGASRPRVLDLGAGTGRIGRAFVTARDDYVGVDLSFPMLRAFVEKRAVPDAPAPRLVQADGRRLPFDDATFDAVLLMQVFGGMGDWRQVLGDVRRVLRPDGAIMIGRTMTPDDGVDSQMRRSLAELLDAMKVKPDLVNVREDAQRWLAEAARSHRCVVAATWKTDRSPRGFLDRHATGARFLRLPQPTRRDSLAQLADWAVLKFGSLDTVCTEEHAFALDIYRFGGADR